MKFNLNIYQYIYYKMKNIIFYSSWENNPEKLLNRYSKMTPNNLGIWNNLKGVTNINNADYIVFLEGIPNNFNPSLLKNIKDILCFPREPFGDKNWEKLSLKYGYTYNNHYHVVTDPQFINKTYDELTFDYNKRDKLLSAVVSNKNLGPSYELRRNFFIKLSTIYPDICDIYGAGWTNEIGSSYKGSLGHYHNKNINNTSKYDALKNYKYTICIESCVRKNYFSEKFTDAILSGCIPIYFGCPNISDYFPNDCYYVVDINDINCYEKIMDIINKPVSEENISALKKAHELILNKYNIWSTVQNKIQNKIQFYSQYSQDKYIYNTFFNNKTNGTFVEIGADDGVRFSNCKFFEDYLGWNGIAIEARKDAYSKLIKNRGCLCVNAVLSDKEEETEFLDIKGYGIGLSGLINKYDKRHIERIRNEVKNPNNKGYDKIIVNTEKLSNILEKQNIYNIDFLSIDTEGSELDILKTLDFNKFNIDVITIEDNYNDRNIIDFFTKKGYELITIIKCDKIFKKNLISHSTQNRINLTISCRDCDKIPKHNKAGLVVIENNYKIQYMYNGIKIYYDSYHSPWMNMIISNLNGHHEPQEELCFYYLIKLLDESSNMIELGCAWAYYSMCFKQINKKGINICVEPNNLKLNKGKKNIKLNNLQNFKFYNGFIGNSYKENDTFIDWDKTEFNIPQYNIEYLINSNSIFIDIIHSDIQGAELKMLEGSLNVLDKIGFFVVSTHGDKHNLCITFLNNNNFTILIEHTIEESVSADGLILAVNNKYINKYEKKINNSLIEYFTSNCNITKKI